MQLVDHDNIYLDDTFVEEIKVYEDRGEHCWFVECVTSSPGVLIRHPHWESIVDFYHSIGNNFRRAW